MTNTLEELTVETLSKDQIARRLDDWERRLVELYDNVTGWLGPDWATKRGTTRMFEPPMREVGLPPRDIARLELFRDGLPRARIDPSSLWIIGWNGRLDLTVGAEGYFIVDEADHFEPPRWAIMSVNDRMRRVPFDRAYLLSIL